MTPFVGTHQGRLDGKGRISIPSQFRALLKAGSTDPSAPSTPLMMNPSNGEACIEVRSETAFNDFTAGIYELDHLSERRNDLELTYFALSVHLKIDDEGRVVIPPKLREEVGLTEKSDIAFVGRGNYFQIWDASHADTRVDLARRRTKERGDTLPGRTR